VDAIRKADLPDGSQEALPYICPTFEIFVGILSIFWIISKIIPHLLYPVKKKLDAERKFSS